MKNQPFTLLLSLFLFACAVAAVDPLVDLSYAQYRGSERADGVTAWLGLRYAAPPVGELRFAAPQDPVREGMRDADQHGPLCLATGGGAPDEVTTSEDCLFLDVYAPSDASEESGLPVYFWIQGGGFNGLSNANYDGAGLIMASEYNMVVVTHNYRVGLYGFLAGDQLREGGSLNNGLKDQRKALQWVQRHISKFGGDPDHVVLGGGSAGAASINLHLTAYGGRDDGLFHATAAESQSFAAMNTVEESQYMYDNLVVRTGCASEIDSLECLRSLDVSFLQTQNFNLPLPGAQDPPLYMYGPTIDGDIVTDYTYRAYEEGKFVRLPAIYGDDTNEGTVFVPRNTNSLAESNTFLHDQFPNLEPTHLEIIDAMYPVAEQFPDSGAYWRQASNAYGELRYICPGIFISDVYARLGINGNWNYRWDVIDPDDEAEGYGVIHTVEVNAIWGSEYTNGGAPNSYYTTNAAIVPVVQAYWTSFIRSFDPNTYRLSETPEWEEWTVDAKQRLKFRTDATEMEDVQQDQRERCSYLSSIGVDLKQ